MEQPGVCTENLIRIDCETESPNVNGDDRALLPVCTENLIRIDCVAESPKRQRL